MHTEFDEAKLRLRFWCIAQDWGSELAKLEVTLSPDDSGALIGAVQLHQRRLEWTFRFSCCGYDLAEFRQQLLLLNAGEKVAADWFNLEESFSMRLETVPSPERTLLVSGLVKCISPDFTWRIPFGGFRGEASYLPDAAISIADFLTVTNVPVAHPMVQSN